MVRVPDADVLFTGDLVEAGQFAIFPWFPPYDTDVSGTRWIAVMERLAAEAPRIVVPGHGEVGGARLLADVRDYLRLLRDETRARRDSAVDERTIVEEVSALMLERHPEWVGREWIEKGVGCLCSSMPSTPNTPSTPGSSGTPSYLIPRVPIPAYTRRTGYATAGLSRHGEPGRRRSPSEPGQFVDQVVQAQRPGTGPPCARPWRRRRRRAASSRSRGPAARPAHRACSRWPDPGWRGSG